MTRLILKNAALRCAFAMLAASSVTGCVPLVLGGAVGGALVASDRRTSGTQLEDKGLEIKAASKVREILGDQGHVNVNAYDRAVLLTGEVPTEADKVAVAQAVARIDNATGVVNELAVDMNSSLSSRANDVLVAGKVKATFVDARDVMSNAVDIVVERGEVYLMGIVTEREANRAAELASTIKGVTRVVKAFKLISEDELARRQPPAAATSASGG